MIDNRISSLAQPFRTMVQVFLTVARLKYPRVVPYETYRTRARQAWLYANKKKIGPVAKPGTSMHEK
jgi:hypothetical protein